MYYLIGAIVVTVLVAIAFVINRLKIAGVNEAIIVSGARQSGEVKVVSPGGKTFVIPVVQSASTLSLLQRKVELTVDALDSNKVPFSVRAVAMFKVGDDPKMIRAAAERFTGQEDAIQPNAQEILLGALRSIMGQMTVVDLIANRAELARAVTETAGPELQVSGLLLDSLQVSDITDKGEYIRNLGIPESEKISRDARIARAEAERDANDAEVAASQHIAEKNRDLEIRRAELRAETDSAAAVSNAAGPLSKAQQDAVIAERERAVAIQVAELRERELDTEVRKPADAKLYEVTKAAEADKAKEIAEAEATARSIELKGEAEAKAIKARGQAEAEALTKRAEALQLLNEAGVTEMLINKLPDIAHELAAPMSSIDDLTIISTDGAGALSKTVANNFAQLDGIVKSFTGSGITDMISPKTNESDEVKE